LLLVGSDNDLNVHGARAFCERAWPQIRAARPEATLRIVGRLSERLHLSDARIEAVGWQRDVEHEWRAAAVVINPTVAPTGLKIKSIEALAYGKPLVAVESSVEGIAFAGEPPFVSCADWDTFAAGTIALLESGARRQALRRRALAWARASLTKDAVYRPLAELLSRRAAA
jgi:glycosyltransferase involved in cell wall biosynthesis